MSSALVLDLGLASRSPARDDADEATPWRAPQEPLPAAAGPRGRPTLDELVVGVWEGLLAHRPTGCPVCGATMLPRAASGAAAAGARCGGCGTTLG